MAAAIKVQFKIQGWKELRKTFAALKKGVRNRVAKAALQAGARPIAKLAKQLAPKADASQTTRGIPIGPGRGLLRKSIGMRGKISRKTGMAYVVVGPRRKKFKMQIGVAKDGTPVFMNPTNYAHLQETGHNIVRGGRVIGHNPGTQFMRRAFEGALPTAQAAIEQKFRQGIAREAMKARVR